jgi:hypothetical protein
VRADQHALDGVVLALWSERAKSGDPKRANDLKYGNRLENGQKLVFNL